VKPACEQAVEAALGRKPTKGELDSIETRIFSSMRDLQAKDPGRWRLLSRDQRLQEGAKLARQKTLEDVTRAQSNTIRDMEIKADQQRRLESFKPGTGKGEGQLAALRQRAVYDAEARGGDLSVEMKRKSIFRDLTRRLEDIGGRGKFWGMVQDPLEQRDLMKAIRDEPTGKPQVDQAGATVRKVMDEALQQMQDAGININRLDDWHTPQPWAWEKVGADREQFVKDALDAIDPDHYINQDGSPMTAAEREKLVRASAETLGTNGANKRAEKQGTGFSGAVGGSRNAPRQLFFKNAEAYSSMMDKYGSADNVHAMLLHHLNGVSRDIAAVRSFGRDADNFFPQMVEKAFVNDAKAVKGSTPEKREKALQKLEKLKKRTLKEWQAMRQPDHPGSMPGWVKVSQAIRGLAGSTLLGSSTLSAIPDLQMAVGYSRLQGVARSKILGNIGEGLNPTNRKTISRLGIVVDGLESAANRFGSEELGPHGIRFLNHVVHVGSGLRMWDRGMAHGVSASIMDMLGEHVSKTDYAALDPKTAQYVEKRGITPDIWNTWKLADLDTGQDGTRTMLTPDAIYDIPDAKLRPLAEQRTAGINKQFEADAAARDARTQQEIEWVKGKTEKFDALKQKTKETLDAMKARASVKDGHAQGVLDARAEQVRGQVARAEVHTDIARYLSTADTQIRAKDFLEAVQEGADIERGVIKQRTHPDRKSDTVVENFAATPSVGEKMNRLIQRYGRGVADKAEVLGRKQAAAEARIDAAQKAVDDAAKDRQSAIDDKSKAFAKRLDDHLTALDEFSAQMRENAGKRRELNDAFQDRYGQEVARETRNLRAEAAQHLIGTALHEVQAGARGGAGSTVADQIGLMLDPGDRGTLRHELASWLLFLKQTPLGIFKTHMFDVPRGLDDWQSAMAYRAKFMAGSAALGALSLEVKNLVNGQDPEDLLTRKGLGKVLVASGGLGMYGDFMFGDKGDHQNGALAKLLGPGATMIEDAINIFHNGMDAATGAAGVEPEPGEQTVRPDQFGAQALRFTRNYMAPLTRIWYAKAAFNHMVYNNIMENLSPGYRDRVEQRMAQRNQTTWWNPTEDTPGRAPDFSAVFGGK
jgi:hypothetical protein